MSMLFISDLHLEESHPQITAAFLRFLETDAAQAERLYILGDFFEAWIGDDEGTPLQLQIADALRTLTQERGTALFLMHGNRDFLIGQDFCAQTGATLLHDPCVIDLYGRPALLMHGDSLCTRDLEYMKFRQNMRNDQWQTLFLKRPLAERQLVARQLRQISMAKNQGKMETIMDVTPEEVVRVMADAGVDLLIHGHTHRPAVHALEIDGQPAERIVLGDWGSHYWFIRADATGQVSLLERPLA